MLREVKAATAERLNVMVSSFIGTMECCNRPSTRRTRQNRRINLSKAKSESEEQPQATSDMENRGNTVTSEDTMT